MPSAVPQELPYGDGATKLFGMENFGNTCYCNSILQCLFYTTRFRQQVLTYNPEPHERKSAVPGAGPHQYTVKYESLLAKKLKDQGKPPASPDGSTSLSPPPLVSRPSIRNSFLGKFSTSSVAMLNPDDTAVSHKKAHYVQAAACCSSLSTEQRLLLSKNPDFSNLQVLVTRPTTEPADQGDRNEGKVESSSSSLDGAQAPACVTAWSSYVVVGIPQPETNLHQPINPFSPNPSVDQRKRSALVSGPIINADAPLSQRCKDAGEKVLLYALKDLFEAMAENRSQIGVVSPSYFVNKLKEKNFLFRQANMHHDAHEFCNYLVNETIETLNSEVGRERNWCTDIFQGCITNETKCLSCETVTSKDEPFLDLSVDVPPGNSAYSLTHSLNNFSQSEVLSHQNKFYCNTCQSLQEAVKTFRLKKLPEVLIINFKRFKYDDKLDRMVKLFDSISYPLNLRLFNTVDEEEDGPPNPGFSLFGLYALVVHIGGGPTHGHYVALCKCKAGLWFLFDDETVELVDESYVLRFFGNGPGLASAYILFYEKLDTKAADDGYDFGIDLNRIYDGGDYALATEANTSKEDPETENSDESLKDFIPEEASDVVGDRPLSRTATILKKTFMFDNKDGDKGDEFPSCKVKAAEPPKKSGKGEKKSWVDGLKRRESKADVAYERKGSVGSIKTANGSITSGSGDESEKTEKSKRRGSIFSFKKKSK